MDKLGGKTWEKKKERARKKVHELAEKLVALYSEQEGCPRFTFTPDTELHREFDGFFPYDETPDQLTAIADIKRDMESEKTDGQAPLRRCGVRQDRGGNACCVQGCV